MLVNFLRFHNVHSFFNEFHSHFGSNWIVMSSNRSGSKGCRWTGPNGETCTESRDGSKPASVKPCPSCRTRVLCREHCGCNLTGLNAPRGASSIGVRTAARFAPAPIERIQPQLQPEQPAASRVSRSRSGSRTRREGRRYTRGRIEESLRSQWRSLAPDTCKTLLVGSDLLTGTEAADMQVSRKVQIDTAQSDDVVNLNEPSQKSLKTSSQILIPCKSPIPHPTLHSGSVAGATAEDATLAQPSKTSITSLPHPFDMDQDPFDLGFESPPHLNQEVHQQSQNLLDDRGTGSSEDIGQDRITHEDTQASQSVAQDSRKRKRTQAEEDEDNARLHRNLLARMPNLAARLARNATREGIG